MSTNPTLEATLEKLSKADLISLVKQMVQLHPDLTGLAEAARPTTKQRIPLNTQLYHRQIADIFRDTDRNTWGSEGRAAGPLLQIKRIADGFVEQQNYADATTLYEMIITSIIDEYDTFRWHHDEGNLNEVVSVCCDGLGKCLAGEHEDEAVREQIIQALYTAYDFDQNLENDEPVMSRQVPGLLVRYTTPQERQTIAAWVRETLEDEIDWHAEDISDDYDHFLLGLEADTIDDETFLRISRETENYTYLIERLLKLGRVDEAVNEAKQIDSYYLLEIADIFSEHGQDALAEEIVQERAKNTQNTKILEWLKKRLQERGDFAGALELAERIFRIYPTLAVYREIRQLAQRLDRWETVRGGLLALLNTSHNTHLLIEIALDEGQIDKALELLESRKQTDGSRQGPYGSEYYNIAIAVAQAAAQTHPHAALEIYKQYAELRIEWRGRENYQMACEYLTNVRDLYRKIGRSELWTSYIKKLREQNSRLPALKDEMAKAKL